MAWLSGHAAVTAAFGGADRVGAVNEPPYPRLRVIDTGGDDRDLRWLIAQDIQVEAYGDLDGAPGKAELRRILYVALGALAELPDQPPAVDYPIITSVRSLRGGGWVPEPTGQPRYLAAVRVYAHP
jgi:hypothetical protein